MIADEINAFRNGTNPLSLPAAAAQADVVGHSMGGLLARWANVNFPQPDDPMMFGASKIHKLITIVLLCQKLHAQTTAYRAAWELLYKETGDLDTQRRDGMGIMPLGRALACIPGPEVGR